MPVFEQLPYLEDLSDDEERSDSNDADFEIHEDSVRRGFDQHKLNDLASDAGLSAKNFSKSSYQDWMRKTWQGVKVSYLRTRESAFLQYFRGDQPIISFAVTFTTLLKPLGLSLYNPNEWRMFIDSS